MEVTPEMVLMTAMVLKKAVQRMVAQAVTTRKEIRWNHKNRKKSWMLSHATS